MGDVSLGMESSSRKRIRHQRKPRRARNQPLGAIRAVARWLQTSPLERLPALSPFDGLIGKLMYEALTASPTGRLSEAQREYIASQVDAAGFVLKDHLEGQSVSNLAAWNQLHSHTPIKTFASALKSKTNKLRYGVLRAWYHAKERYARSAADLSAS